eukprot:SAG31_NODE_9243_length_1309_cov_1.161157_1_plen_101_part_10
MASAGNEHRFSLYATHHELVSGTLPHEILHNRTEILDQLAASGDLLSVASEQDQYGATAFAIAAFVGASEVLQKLLQVDGAPQVCAASVDGRGNTPLAIAA